jgi:hypothetical protein
MQTQNPRLPRRLPDLQDIHRPFEWVQDHLERWQIELKNILRWEDDGGRVTAGETRVPHEQPRPADLVYIARKKDSHGR